MEFKGQLLYNSVPIKAYSILIEGNPHVSNDGGIFQFTLNPTVSLVKIQPSDKRFVILYPRNGILLIPKNNTLIAEIILGAFSSNNYLKEYVTVSKELQDISNKTAVEVRSLQDKLDSITSMLTRMNYSNDDLAAAKRRRDGIDLFYPEITKALNNSLLKMQNVRNAFENNARFALSNSSALNQLETSIREYNPWIDKVYENHTIWAQKISENWQSDSLRASFETIANTMIYDVHRKHILLLNDIKNQINQYFFGGPANKTEQNKQKIISDINAVMPILDPKLESLERSVTNFIKELSDY